jgi:hypothetical protein
MESPTSLLAAAALRSSPPPRVPRPRRPRRGVTLAGLIAVLAAALAPAADADTRTLTLVTDGVFGADPAVPAKLKHVAADGSRVFFKTNEVMAASDTDVKVDVYMRAGAGAPMHITDNPVGPDGALEANYADRSSDLTRVVIATKERLAPTDTDTAYDLYERLPDGTLVHLSDDPTGPDANVDVEFDRLSADLRRVYFTTDESLSPTDTDGVADGYMATLLPDRPTTRPRPRPGTPRRRP